MTDINLHYQHVRSRVFKEYRFSAYTYRLYDSKLRFIHAYRYRFFFSRLPQHADAIRGCKMLEVGCSDLFTLAMLSEGGLSPRSYLGIDVFWEDAERYANSNAKALAQKFHIDIETINQSSDQPVPDTDFDTCFLLETLEHLPNEDVALENIKNALRPNGLLFLAVPVEFGVLFAAKETARFFLSGRSDYTASEFLNAMRGRLDSVSRVVGDHKGYDFRRTTARLSNLGFQLVSQAIFPGPTATLGYSPISVWRKGGQETPAIESISSQRHSTSG
ncbi:MAG: class I SAM-dependent methyltransferase [Betaproteobacteria bacterium]|nr:class I SAM-dependent methyltransferase [Betaproteobacteria bacterium]